MRYSEGIGEAFLVFGLMVVTKAGLARGGELTCAALGLVLMASGAILMAFAHRKRAREAGEKEAPIASIGKDAQT